MLAVRTDQHRRSLVYEPRVRPMTPDPAESVEARLRAGLPGLIFAVTRCLAAAADAAAAKGAVDDDDAAADADDAAAAREILAPNFARRGEWETQPLAEIAQTAFNSHREWFERAEAASAGARAAWREVRELATVRAAYAGPPLDRQERILRASAAVRERPVIYLASRFRDHPLMREWRDQLTTRGYEVSSRWINPGDHEGEDRSRFAREDMADVRRANVMISRSDPAFFRSGRGGRHVEFGLALAWGMRIILVGERENVFHWMPGVELAATFDDALVVLAAAHPNAAADGVGEQP